MVNGGTFTSLVSDLQYYGILDVVLPFLLVFTLVFAVLQRIKLFGEDKKSINVVIAVIMGILTVVPHITGNYPQGYDPVLIINTLLPSVSILAVVIILILFLWGMFGGEWAGGSVPGIVILVILVIMGYIFGATVGWWAEPSQTFGSWWGSNLSTLIIIILVFGAIFWFITGGEKKTPGESMMKGLKELFKGRS
ncbi:hypothetical protein KY306_02670 [Candidatus Woesearchaeota archaeon]|nr:hypothetical protein [Candidatus Woesearchaeota archaeon]